MAHSFESSTQRQKQVDLSEFRTNLVCRTNSRIVTAPRASRHLYAHRKSYPHVPYAGRKRLKTPWNWSYKFCGSLIRILGINTRSSARTESTSNHGATSHASSCLVLFCFGMLSLAKLKLPNQAKLSRAPQINLSLPSTINIMNTCHHT